MDRTYDAPRSLHGRNIVQRVSFLNSLGLTQDSKNVLLDMGSSRYEPSRLDLSPLGGSLVILMPFYRMDTGKSLRDRK